MDGQQLAAASGDVATAYVPGSPDAPAQGGGNPAAQIDWNSEENPLREEVAKRERELAEANARFAQLQQAAQQYAAQEARKQQEERQRQRDRALEEGEMTAAQYKAAIDQERAEERAALETQLKQVLTPVWAKEFAQQQAQQHGLSPEEVHELETVAPEAIPWVAQRIARERQTRQTFEERIQQLERSIGAQQVVHQGVTRSATGATAGSAPQQFTPGSIGHLRAALAEIGATNLIGH